MPIGRLGELVRVDGCLSATFSQLGNFMNGGKNTLDLDINLTLCVVSKCSNRGQEAAPEDTVERGYVGYVGRRGGCSCAYSERGRGVKSKAKCSYVGEGRRWVLDMMLDRFNLAHANVRLCDCFFLLESRAATGVMEQFVDVDEAIKLVSNCPIQLGKTKIKT